MTGYLSGSTINITYKNNPQRYTGGYVTEDFFKIVGVSPVLGRDFTVEDNKPGSTVMAARGGGFCDSGSHALDYTSLLDPPSASFYLPAAAALKRFRVICACPW